MTRPYFCTRSLRRLCGRTIAHVLVVVDGVRVERFAKTHAAAIAALPASVDRARLPVGW